MGLMSFPSCTENDYLTEEELPAEVLAENLRDITASDLETMIDILKESGVDPETLEKLNIYASESDDNNSSLRSSTSLANILVKAIKVSTKIKNPDGSGRDVTISGILLVPRISLFPLRIVVASVGTYGKNEDAPSNMFKTLSLERDNGKINYLYYFTLQATQGFAILFPDYLGYGDSFGDATLPLLVKEPLVNSTIDLVKAAQETLKKNKYSYKKELILAGYSLGAYVSTSLYQKLENDANMPVKLTIAGGTPLDLNDIINRARSESTLASPFMYPYLLSAYNIYEKQPFSISDLLKVPYGDLTYIRKAINGTRSVDEINEFFTDNVSDLFTDEVIKGFDKDPKFNNIRSILDKNSLKPWKNKTRLALIHGMKDDLIFYESTYNFYKEQKKLNGNITFTPVIAADHVSTALAFYIETSALLLMYK